MAAGLGFKTFQTGEVLTAADTNGYLMQGVLVFASAAARDAAITSPQEGQFAYLKDTNVTTYYTGSAWANLDTTGMTNPMTTTGDTIYSSSGSTPARLGIGTAGQVLTVNSGATAPQWSTPGGGSLRFIQRSSFTDVATTGTTFDSVFSSTYKSYQVVIEKMHAVSGATADVQAQMDLLYSGTAQTANYYGGVVFATTPFSGIAVSNAAQQTLNSQVGYDVNPNSYILWFGYVGNASEKATYYGLGFGQNNQGGVFFSGGNQTARTYTGFRLKAASGNITGTVAIYGIATS